MAEQLVTLKAKRTSTKASISRIKTYVDTKTDLLPEEIECRLELLEAYFKQLLAIQDAIESIDPGESKSVGEMEDTYCTIKAKLLKSIGEQRRKNSLAESSLNTSQAVMPAIVATTKSNLPKLQLPRFSGIYIEYTNFKNTFDITVHADKTLTNIEKFIHLKSCLTGEALRTIQGLEISSQNYSKALELLQARYDNKYLIFESHIHKLFELPTSSKGSAEQLKGLVDEATSHLKSMQSLGSSDDILNSLIIHIVKRNLDAGTRKKWEESLTFDAIPDWDTFSKFLQDRCQHLDCFEAGEKRSSAPSARKCANQTSLVVSKSSCEKCHGSDHLIHKCSKFLNLSVMDRFQEAKRLNLCLNCLHKGHSVKNCLSSKCRVCNLPHHTLLHRHNTSNLSHSNCSPLNSTQIDDKNRSNSATVEISQPTPSTLHASKPNANVKCDQIVLATAIVLLKDKLGNFVPARALLDSASQLNLISESLSRKLQLVRHDIEAVVGGIGNTNLRVSHAAIVTIKSRLNESQFNLETWILPRITHNQPEARLNIDSWNIPNNIVLADPTFHIPQKVDILLGAESFYQLLSVGQINLGEGLPLLQKTLFGWIVAGRYIQSHSAQPSCHIAIDSDIKQIESSLSDRLESFWKIEHVGSEEVNWSPEHHACEDHFKSTITRAPDGRFVVKFPFKENPNVLGESYNVAYKNFQRLEKRLKNSSELKQQYVGFINEYLKLNHMEEWTGNPQEIKYFIPHHGVSKPTSSSTKLRVVFNASAPTSTNKSLNDILMTGPTVQDELYDIAVRFRCKKYAMTADISKMYRQIWVDADDRHYLGILWRDCESKPIRIFTLKTVTYGTTSAPYQATRCLKELADNLSLEYPMGADAIRHNMYVDDLLVSVDAEDDLFEVKNQIESILSAGKFELRKWASNHSRFLEAIPPADREPPHNINNCNIIKALGIMWDPVKDDFHFEWSNSSQKVTKRNVLSEICSIFDPLGLLNPVIVTAKIFMQELWSLNIDWDESLPLEAHNRWIAFRNQLADVNSIRIPRYIACDSTHLELHGFADASTKAYGCCFYAKSITASGVIVNLVTAKSRVAPLKSLTLPRLELCAALLLAKMAHRLTTILQKPINFTLWSDSEIVLHWILGDPSAWTVFVANRVATIQSLVGKTCWRHVDSKNNPADVVSRGGTVQELMSLRSIWFTGPKFLTLSSEYWPQNDKFQPWMTELPEKRKSKLVLIAQPKIVYSDLTIDHKYVNSYSKICRIFALSLNFINKLKSKLQARTNISTHLSMQLSSSELENAFLRIVFNIQQCFFVEEINAIKHQKSVSSKSHIRSLCPFLDNNSPQLLRVGGRLQHADIPYNAKYPILLSKHPLVLAYLTYLHKKLFHAGPQAIVAASREKFWILNVKNLATHVVHKCIHCTRYRPKLFQQIMGHLPSQRTHPARPFFNTGVDFCGPIKTTFKLRGQRYQKSYIALFICFAIKAVHLEVVGDLSADAFIGALKRFVARRGLCCNLFCDNATNFIGANSKLKELYEALFSDASQINILKACSNERISFHFIPPRSPHFGGLWEAAIKSAKFHLYRTLHNSILTFEELNTVVVQIEAALNSRPISAMSSDPNDERALTPGHFLIGESLCGIPEPDVSDKKLSYLKRWQHVSILQQHFWKRWSREYVPILQQRYKWNSTPTTIKNNMLVLIADENLPPQKWLLGRIVSTIQGSDGHVRVADVKTKNNIIRRAIHRLAPLPIEPVD